MNKKIIIKNIALATIVTLNMTGCSLVKTNTNVEIANSNSISTKAENNYQDQLIEFEEVIKNSNLNINMDNFYLNTKTLNIIIDNSNKSAFASYNIDTNIITVANDGEESLKHELLHLLFANRQTMKRGLIDNNDKGKSIDEGIIELLTCELFNKKNTYNFEYGTAKIFTQILGKEKVIEALNTNNIEILIEALAKIVPEYKDADELIKHCDYSHKLSSKMHDDYFTNGNINNFKNTDDYMKLKNDRSDIIKRLKIYIKKYYHTRITDDNINPYDELTSMIALLNTVDNNLFDPDIEVNKRNDFFLKEEVTKLMNKYNITNEEYDKCVKNAKDKKYFINDNNKKKNVK